MGGKQAGCIGLLTCCAFGLLPKRVIACDDLIQKLGDILFIPTGPSIKEISGNYDLLVSVHGRRIIPKEDLDSFKYGGINVHPCLSEYPGMDPIQRFLTDGKTRASVGVHRMTDKVDAGEVLVEEWVDVTGKKTVEEVYNALYPYYSIALIKVLRKIL